MVTVERSRDMMQNALRIYGIGTPEVTGILMVLWLLASIGAAVATGKVAERKGYSFAPFLVLGLFLSFIGLIIALIMPYRQDGWQASGESSKASAIAEYKRLLDDGAITQEEYDAAKGRILAGDEPKKPAQHTVTSNPKWTGPVRVYIRYHRNDVATATVEDGDDRRLYGESRKNSGGMPHRDFCAEFADDIERKLGRKVKWSMEEVM